METHQNKDTIPSCSSVITQDTLSVASEQLFKLQEQLLQLRLNVAGETRTSSSNQATDKSRSSTTDRPIDSKPTSTSEATKLETIESSLVDSIRSRISHVKEALQNTVSDSCNYGKPKDESPFADNVLLAWHRTFNKSEYAEALCNQLEQLQKKEAEEVRHMYWLVKDQQRQCVTGLQKYELGKDRDEDNIHVRLERIEKALLELAASKESKGNAIKVHSTSQRPSWTTLLNATPNMPEMCQHPLTKNPIRGE